jgi:hypothetical protein
MRAGLIVSPGQRRLARQAGAHGQRGAAQEQPGIRDPIVGVERDELGRAALLELGRGARVEVQRLELASRRVDHDQRARHLGRDDLVGDAPALADVVQHDAEVELLREPQDGDDVVVAVRVVVDDALLVEHLEQAFHRQVARRLLVGVVAGGLHLAAVLLRGHELLAHERGRLPARARERRGALGVRAVRHLHAAHDRAVGKW